MRGPTTSSVVISRPGAMSRASAVDRSRTARPSAWSSAHATTGTRSCGTYPGHTWTRCRELVATDRLVDGVPERSRAAGLPIDGNDDRTAVSCAHRTSLPLGSPPAQRDEQPRPSEPKVTMR